MRPRPDGPPCRNRVRVIAATLWARPALLLGLALLGAAWIGPLPGLAARSFTAHMVLHVAVVAVAAPLLALGLAGSRLDPARIAPRLTAPVPATVLDLVVVWGWHAPALHLAARHLPGALAWEQGMFLSAGLLVWSSAFGGTPALRAGRAGSGLLALLLTSMHMTLLGALLAIAPRPLYGHGGAGHGQGGVPGIGSGPGLDALADQQLGGVVMLLVGGVSYLAGGLTLLVRLLEGRPAPERRP